jgi:hypothetical protein
MRKGDMVDATDRPQDSESMPEIARPPRPRSPLIIGGIACGMIVWMFIVVMLLIAWKVLS